MTKILKYITYFTITSLAIAILGTSGIYLYLAPNLPVVDDIENIPLQIPLRVYSRDGQLIGEFGDKRRTPIAIEDVPEPFIQAFLAAEDHTFYQHPGISVKHLIRATLQMLMNSSQQTGGSTITQQVAKNYFLTSERKIVRKIREIFLALKIEQQLSKDQILELYVNKIFLGNRAYGIAAAAQTYYGKPVSELSLSQMAMIAGLPKSPSAENPISNPDQAIGRRNWILGRMATLGYIDTQAAEQAIAEPISAQKHQVEVDIDSPYAAEMARKYALKEFGNDAYTAGYRIITSLDGNLQKTAQKAVKNGILAYDQRHGFKGVELHVDELTEETKSSTFSELGTIADFIPAIVTQIEDKSIVVELADQQQIEITWESGLSTVRKYKSENKQGSEPEKASDIVKIGDVVRIRQNSEGAWIFSQIPDVEAALIALDPFDGSIIALVGGYDFYKSKFNRATQAARQLGSNIKPFIYSAALNNGFTPATIINDAPIVFDDAQLESVWRPKGAGTFRGPTRMREALYLSLNLVSVRILQQLNIKETIEYLTRFGFYRHQLPKDLSLALGSPSFSPLDVATAYATFANGGFKVSPHLIKEVYNGNDELIYKANPALACDPCEENKPEEELFTGNILEEEISSIEELEMEDSDVKPEIRQAERIMNERTVFLIDNILQDVTARGTAYKAGSTLKRWDIAGKTGTTNNSIDAWFSGYHPNIVTTTWMGFDNNTSLGAREYGGTAALPIWLSFMAEALKNEPILEREPPAGVVSVLIDKETGKRAQPGQENTMFEFIQEELLPTIEADSLENEEENIDIEDIF